ncbi:uncharacterized protein LOC125077805 [Vanessa atalanta]|uniref:uncharacterized protein LOC125077805 n=1 Tax=Vanessa atalanta TaxID=42275 RepID=UPI001FCDFEEA|nr:uncharacterized protein LOC125077805 [Vanessa atalanta]
MPNLEAPCVELGSAPRTPSIIMSPSPSEVSSASSLELQNVQATPLFRVLALPPPEPEQPPGQDELERRLPGYRRIVIPRELTLIELLKQSSGVRTDDEVLRIREAKLRVVAERVGLRRLHVLAPHLRTLVLDGSAMTSLRDLGIGLIKLKSLSVNRCGLNSLDGVWGLGALRELYAAGNRLHDLHALAALQKLHTLNLANNPIEESSRIWTLGVCCSLRKLTLSGTPIADSMNYRSLVASALPMLVTLDERPLNSNEDDWNYDIPSDSESVESFSETSNQRITDTQEQDEPRPGPSKLECEENDLFPDERPSNECSKLTRRRPATSECAGIRPRCEISRRPKTALERNIDGPTRLQIMNTLLDDEWRCSGSKLTSHGAVSGNLARALRRPKQISKHQNSSTDSELEMVEKTMEEACRALAAEIPCAPNSEDWAKFKQETGIEIDIDFNEWPKETDPSKVIERLEQIERDTLERLNNDTDDIGQNATHAFTSDPSRIFSRGIAGDYELWKEMQDLITCDPPNNVDDLFKNLVPINPRRRESDNDSLE